MSINDIFINDHFMRNISYHITVEIMPVLAKSIKFASNITLKFIYSKLYAIFNEFYTQVFSNHQKTNTIRSNKTNK